MNRTLIVILSCVFLLCGPAAARAADGQFQVVASVRPVHALVSAVMAGVGTPILLLESGSSPHDYALKPSDAAALSRASAIFWMGPHFETFLEKPLRALAGRARIVALMEAPGGLVLPARKAGLFVSAPPAADTSKDGHVWLDPGNAEAMASYTADILSTADPANAARYRANAQRFVQEARVLDRELAARLAPVRQKPFVVLHDAYQYFERRYDLTGLGSLSATPEQSPGARRFTEIQETLRGREPVCIFLEPKHDPPYVRTLAASTGARVAILDPEGIALSAGATHYFALMRNLADAFVSCLG